METALYGHHRYWSILTKQGSSLRFGSLLKAQNVATASLAMRAGGGDLALRRVSWNILVVNSRLRHPRPFFAQPIFNPQFMAQKPDSLPIQSKLDEGKEKQSEKIREGVPPPPEKPLPGDCCGSGCVRCVWDVYYEELEDYNKLYKQDENPKS